MSVVPLVVLHDHLDGGLRIDTILELAASIGHELPATDPDELRSWFRAGADARDILQYLATFEHTVGLLQTADALRRVATEAVVDLAADGVVYAEVRFAPELHPGVGGLSEVIDVVTAGFAAGAAHAAAAGNMIDVRTIVCAMRTENRSADVARAAVAAADPTSQGGVVAFDLAGAETGFPPTDHAVACRIALDGGLALTVHASEPPGTELIAQALEVGAQRVGHGVRLIEDCRIGDDGGLELGSLAQRVLDEQVPLELCPSCNVQIGAVPTLADHPIGPFLRAGFAATVNTDNRLMSGVTVSSEVAAVRDAFDLTDDEVRRLQRNAIAAAFCDEATRSRVAAVIAD